MMKSVQTALRVFETVAELQPIGLSELARQTETPKSTVQRCLTTLEASGWVRATPASGQWVITARAYTLGSRIATEHDIRSQALPALSALQIETTETIHLTVPDGDEMVLVERLDSSHQLRAFLPLGTRLPLHAASNGKAFMAAQTDDWIARYMTSGFAAQTKKTKVTAAALWDDIEQTRARGYAVTDGELHDGISSVAVSVRDENRRVVACFSISGPSSRISPDRYADLGQQAVRTRDALERTLYPR